MSAHTPGPWEYQPYESSDDGFGVIAVRDDIPRGGTPTRGLVAWVHRRNFEPKSVSEANARLIAASPTLLAALRDLVTRGEQQAADDGEDDLIEATPWLDAARAALAALGLAIVRSKT